MASSAAQTPPPPGPPPPGSLPHQPGPTPTRYTSGISGFRLLALWSHPQALLLIRVRCWPPWVPVEGHNVVLNIVTGRPPPPCRPVCRPGRGLAREAPRAATGTPMPGAVARVARGLPAATPAASSAPGSRNWGLQSRGRVGDAAPGAPGTARSTVPTLRPRGAPRGDRQAAAPSSPCAKRPPNRRRR